MYYTQSISNAFEQSILGVSSDLSSGRKRWFGEYTWSSNILASSFDTFKGDTSSWVVMTNSNTLSDYRLHFGFLLYQAFFCSFHVSSWTCTQSSFYAIHSKKTVAGKFIIFLTVACTHFQVRTRVQTVFVLFLLCTTRNSVVAIRRRVGLENITIHHTMKVYLR